MNSSRLVAGSLFALFLVGCPSTATPEPAPAPTSAPLAPASAAPQAPASVPASIEAPLAPSAPSVSPSEAIVQSVKDLGVAVDALVDAEKSRH